MRDLESMRAFYASHLGGRSGARYHNPDTGFTSYFLAFDGGARLELMHRPDVGRAPDGPVAGFAHVAFSLGSRHAVDAAVAELRTQGIQVISGPRRTGDGYYEAVVLDPEGNRIELTE